MVIHSRAARDCARGTLASAHTDLSGSVRSGASDALSCNFFYMCALVYSVYWNFLQRSNEENVYAHSIFELVSPGSLEKCTSPRLTG